MATAPAELTVTLRGAMVSTPEPGAWCEACALPSAVSFDLHVVGNGTIDCGIWKVVHCLGCGWQRNRHPDERGVPRA